MRENVRGRMQRDQVAAARRTGQAQRGDLGQRAGDAEHAGFKAEQHGDLFFEFLDQFAVAVGIVADIVRFAPSRHRGEFLRGARLPVSGDDGVAALAQGGKFGVGQGSSPVCLLAPVHF